MANTPKIKAQFVTQRQRMLNGSFEIPYMESRQIIYSPSYSVNGVQFLMKVIVTNVNGYDSTKNYVFVKFTKPSEDTLNYTYKLSSKKFACHLSFSSDDSSWREVFAYEPSYVDEDIGLSYHFDVTVEIEAVKPKPADNFIATLHNDTELTDFELIGADGSVKVHKTILAAASPVLRRMLAGEWSESKNGSVDINGIPTTALQHLKDYIYLRSLPETGLEQLLQLASYYMMEELEEMCIYKLTTQINASNALQLSEFAVRNNMTRLHLAILECFENELVKVQDIKKEMSGKRRADGENETAKKQKKERPCQ